MMGVAVDHTGKRYGKLVAIKSVGVDGDRAILWLAKCDCGAEVVKKGHRLTQSAKNGHVWRSMTCDA